jgi:ubiquitin carboxyl-terminal hydrolase 4/11/15
MEGSGFLHNLVESTKTALVEGEEWCLISMEWWKMVLDALEEGLDDVELPDVDNLNICESSEQKEGIADAVLRRGLKEDIDYKLVPYKTWELIHTKYGGGPRFVRQVIEIRGQPQVEIYLYSLRVTYMKRPEVVDPEDYKSSIPEIKAMQFDVSRKSTIKDIRAEFFSAFEISPEAASNLALFNYLDDTLGDVLEDYVDERDPSRTTWKETSKLATVHSVRLVDSQALLLDTRSSDAATSNGEPSSSDTLLPSTTSGEDVVDGVVQRSWPTLPELFEKPCPFPRGICGIRNLGNTCFMNSALQCLSATEPLMEYFVTGRFSTELNPKNPLGKGGELAMEFGKLVTRLWGGREPSVVPRDFKWMLGNWAKRFDDFSQQDSQELLAFLLDGLHEDCNRVLDKPQTPSVDVLGDADQAVIDAADKAWKLYKLRNDSRIVDLFQAQLKSKLECSDCGHVSITFDPFMYLSLPIPTDSIRTKEILFSFRGGMLRCAIQLPRTALMSQIKLQLQAATGVSATRIVLADIHSSKVHKKFHNSDRFDSVSNSDQLVAFELQYDITKPLLQKLVVPVYQRVLKPEWDQKADRFGYSSTCVSLPTFIAVDKHITYGDLQVAVKRQLSTFIDFNQPGLASKRFPFTISKIKANGATVCHLEEWRGGSATGVNKEGQQKESAILTATEARKLHLVIQPGDILSVDWDLSAFSGKSPGPRLNGIKEHGQFQSTMASGAEIAAKPVTLDDCFKSFIKPERLDGGNAWRCPQCQVDREATKTISIWTLPDVLVVHLKRFTETIYNRQKLNNLIEFPLHQFDVAPYIASRPDGTQDSRHPGQQTKYELYAVSNHYGGLGGGHYTATTQHFMTGQWYEYDDAEAHKILEKEVQSSAAYVLFYRRLPPLEDEDTSVPGASKL